MRKNAKFLRASGGASVIVCVCVCYRDIRNQWPVILNNKRLINVYYINLPVLLSSITCIDMCLLICQSITSTKRWKIGLEMSNYVE